MQKTMLLFCLIFLFVPVFFDERPLNIKSAVSLADKLKEKPLENKNENKSEVCVNLKNITFAYNKNQRDILSCLDFKAYKLKLTV